MRKPTNIPGVRSLDGAAPGSAIPPGHRAPGPEPSADKTKRVHGVPDRDEIRTAGWSAVLARLPAEFDKQTVDSYHAIWGAGFDAGERYGYTFGFANGGANVSTQLLNPVDRGMRHLKYNRRGNTEGRDASTPLQAHTTDQLTAEIAGIMSAYAALPTAMKARALVDALKSLPGVHVDNIAVEQDA